MRCIGQVQLGLPNAAAALGQRTEGCKTLLCPVACALVNSMLVQCRYKHRQLGCRCKCAAHQSTASAAATTCQS